MRRTLTILTTAACAVLLAACGATASATPKHAPPNGKYTCTIGADSQLFNAVTITSGGHYRFAGTSGDYTIGGKTSWDFGAHGWSIHFTSGPLKKYTAGWYHGSDGKKVVSEDIAMTAPGSDFQDIYCELGT